MPDRGEDVHELMKQWGAWRARGRFSLRQWPVTKAFTPPGYASFWKTCPGCHGSKTVADISGSPVSACLRCNGRGGWMQVYPQIDPATIHGRDVMGVKEPPPAVYLLIDRAVEAASIRRRAVVYSRYIFCAYEAKSVRLARANLIIDANGEQPVSKKEYGAILAGMRRQIAEIIYLQ